MTTDNLSPTVPERPDLMVGPRWSSAVRCTRRAAYEGTGAEREPLSRDVSPLFARGHIIGTGYAQAIAADLRAQGERPRLEEEAAWPPDDPVGTLHIDIYRPARRRVTEVKTSSTGDIPESGMIQAAGGALAHPRARDAELVVINPSDLTTIVLPLDPDGLRPEVERRWGEVVRAMRGEGFPERACKHPLEWDAQLCPFRGRCFDGWVRPEPEELIGYEREFGRLADIEEQMRMTGSKRADLERERAVIRERLVGLLTPGTPYECAGVTITLVEVAPRRTFRLADFEKAGHRLDAVAQEFVNEGAPSVRWTVRRNPL